MLTIFSLFGKSESLSWRDNDPGTQLASKIHKELLRQPSPSSAHMVPRVLSFTQLTTALGFHVESSSLSQFRSIIPLFLPG